MMVISTPTGTSFDYSKHTNLLSATSTATAINKHPNISVFDNMEILSEGILLELLKSNPTRSVAADIMNQKNLQSEKIVTMCLDIFPDLYVTVESKEKWAVDLIRLCKLELL